MSIQPPEVAPFYTSETLETGIVGPYQGTDRRIVDYQQVMLAGHAFRGPLPAAMYKRRKLTFLGAAQTFGRFTRVPFPDIMGSLFNLDVLNLGYAGAGASFYLSKPTLLQYASNSALTVVQVMSGRSAENSMFASPDGRNTLIRRSDGKPMTDAPAYRWVLEEKGPEVALELVRESQKRWVEETIELASKIETRKILFWFSVRPVEFTPTAESLKGLMGDFPHFVSREMIEEVTPHFDAFVECTSSRGLPYKLRDRFDNSLVDVNFAGSQRNFNTYYPSPEMHLDAAITLEEPMRKILTAKR
ncbi:DUF6473 family protein [Salipiger sp. P9]|uniref:DUF6473 family protein n=1 Tax=Salipiger pentaromativorans TaxID=2943193 RepID=UPI002157353D|nr:DUF6473 family protein [Salipiger pentaromativorans]MCR8550889.1 DUF6473 family protein [Salipiger pentaromativorans]